MITLDLAFAWSEHRSATHSAVAANTAATATEPGTAAARVARLSPARLSRVGTRSAAQRPDRVVAALDGVLRGYHPDTVRTHRIARAIVTESRRRQLSPALLAGVLLVENPEFRVGIVNRYGATGLFQVMPIHAGRRECASKDLRTIDGNACHGSGVLRDRLDARKGNLHRALLDYNGCVRGTNTPGCNRYPTLVLTRAQRVGRQLAAAGLVE